MKRADQMLQARFFCLLAQRLSPSPCIIRTLPLSQCFSFILKNISTKHAFSGEVKVSFESLPQGLRSPDNLLGKVVNHFENAGLIRDKYLYFLQVQRTGKTDDKHMKMVRGMGIEYQLCAATSYKKITARAPGQLITSRRSRGEIFIIRIL